MARALRHDTDHAQAFDRALLLEGINDLLRAIAKVITANNLSELVGIIAIREGDRKVSACDQVQDRGYRFCVFVRNGLEGRSDNTARSLIESTVNIIELILIHIGELFAQAIPTVRVLYLILAPSEDRVEFISGKIKVLHGNYLSGHGRVALADLPFAFPH